MIRTLVLVTALAAPLAASAQGYSDSNYVFSPAGPGGGNGALALGARVFVVPDSHVPIPMVELGYARGLTDDIHLTASLATLGVVTTGDLGLRARLLGGLDSFASLAFTGGVTAVGVIDASDAGTAGGFVGALTPGLQLGFGGRAAQVTLGLDAPIALVSGHGSSSEDVVLNAERTILLRPSLALEGRVSDHVNMFVRGSFIAVPESGGIGMPSLSIGASF
jgi:hypothetical protein